MIVQGFAVLAIGVNTVSVHEMGEVVEKLPVRSPVYTHHDPYLSGLRLVRYGNKRRLAVVHPFPGLPIALYCLGRGAIHKGGVHYILKSSYLHVLFLPPLPAEPRFGRYVQP